MIAPEPAVEPRGQPILQAIGDPTGNLAAFLRRHGRTTDDLLGQIRPWFGTLDLVMASGSVVVGYANERSDVDLYVLSDVADQSRIPVMSHELGPLLDMNLLAAAEVATQIEWLRNTPSVVPSGGAPARTWRTAARALDRATRLAYGVVLDATQYWFELQKSLVADWLAERALTWWRIEARRRLLMARWLAEVNPALAAQLNCEAQLCALKACTTRAGYLYFNQKWVAKELRAMEQSDLLAVYRRAMRGAWSTGESVAETAEVVNGLIGAPPVGLSVEVAYARGVTTHRVGGATLVSRWEMRGVVLNGDLPSARRDGGCIWEGAMDELPPDWLIPLLRLGLLWVGVANGAD